MLNVMVVQDRASVEGWEDEEGHLHDPEEGCV